MPDEFVIASGDTTRLLVREYENGHGQRFVTVAPQYRDRSGSGSSPFGADSHARRRPRAGGGPGSRGGKDRRRPGRPHARRTKSR